MDLMSIARTGLRVGETMATAAASNIANSHSVTTVPAVTPAGAVPAIGTYPYRPQRAVATARAGGGANVTLEERDGAVDPAEELVDLMVAQNLYTANAAVLRVDKRMRDSFDRLA
jgi:flagellar basal body rod protein FlgC